MSLRIRKRAAIIIMFLIGLSLLNLGGTLVSAHEISTTSTVSTTSTYVDKELGFSLQFPAGWAATPHPGRANNSNTSVAFTNTQLPETIMQIGVMQSAQAPVDFASRGKPTLHIGNYPAFQANTRAGSQVRVPCLGRIFLAHNDTVIATWCSPDAATHVQQFETILATYLDHTATFSRGTASIKPMTQAPINPVLSCSQVMQNTNTGDFPQGDATFGAQRVNPNDSAWTKSFGEGVAVCDNYSSSSGAMWKNSYLFQCVELANRFINEEWGLAEFNSDAFAYYDNYQGGAYQPGEARTLFGNQVQLTDDATQGNNSALPRPGDLLVFQDVNDGAHWTSGEIGGEPGHVVVVTSVTSTQVNVTQENWRNGEIWSFPISKLSNGYHIVDNSGWHGRITRGWIHFSANTSGGVPSSDANFMSSNGSGGSALQVGYLPANPAQLDVFALGKDNNAWDLYKTGGANSPWSNWGSDGKSGVKFDKLSVGTFSDGRLNLFATGSDGQVWNRYKQTTASNSQWSGWGALGQAPAKLTGQVQVGTLPNGAMYLFVLGSDNNVWSIYKTGTDTNSPWSGWGSLGNSGVQFNQLSVGTFSDGRLNLFATGSDGQVWNRYKQTTASTSQWSGWGALGQAPVKLTGQVQVGTLPNGAMYLFVPGSDNNVWSIYKTGTDTNSAWSGWGSLGNSGVQFNQLSVGAFSDGRLNLFATGSDGQVWNIYKETTASTSQWSGWGVLGQASVKLTGQVQVGTLADGRIYLFVVGSDNSLWGNYKTSTSTNSAWSGWASFGQPAGSGGLIQ